MTRSCSHLGLPSTALLLGFCCSAACRRVRLLRQTFVLRRKGSAQCTNAIDGNCTVDSTVLHHSGVHVLRSYGCLTVSILKVKGNRVQRPNEVGGVRKLRRHFVKAVLQAIPHVGVFPSIDRQQSADRSLNQQASAQPCGSLLCSKCMETGCTASSLLDWLPGSWCQALD